MLSSLGYWVGYHVFIERDGKYTLTRKYYEEGAHAKGFNKEYIGIGLAGHFDYEAPTKAQLDTIELVRRDFALYTQQADVPIKYHFEVGDTHCPGAYFMSNDWKLKILTDRLNWLQKILLWIKTNLQR